MQNYNHRAIEKKWQNRWQKQDIYKARDSKAKSKNFYLLVEFPYPSGNLHIGHWYAFAVPDIFARFKRMQGNNVLYPIGFDSFGLPAENAAIKRGLDPRRWTYNNIKTMRAQIRSMGASFDWLREIITSDAEYYKWTEWLFIKMFEAGLVYRKKSLQNWCPSCKTVLANEQVKKISDLKTEKNVKEISVCERCDTEVTEKNLAQWFLKITDYADRLLKDLDALDWPEEIKQAQRNWIGKSEGALIRFQISDLRLSNNQVDKSKFLEVFTTRPDTLYGATFIVLSPEHEMMMEFESLIENILEVKRYIEGVKKKTHNERVESKNKSGVLLKGISAINPVTNEKIPIFIADYVLSDVGTGAIMGVPAHDERDFEFANKHCLGVRKVVGPIAIKAHARNALDVAIGADDALKIKTECWFGDGVLINSGQFSGMSSEKAKIAITKHVKAKLVSTYRLRDWLISRQRYWGTPIPLLFCENCKQKEDEKGALSGLDAKQNLNPGWHAVPLNMLPVILPKIKDYLPTGNGESPLAKNKKWISTECPECGAKAVRETDTMDTFMDSSWYFLRYLDPKNARSFSSLKKQGEWMPIDLYSGGAEHTTMHLLYSRFFYKAMSDLGLVSDSLKGGNKSQIGIAEPFLIRMNRGLILGPDGQKMSKSRGNVIDPDQNVKMVGADTVRMYLAFVGPYNEVGTYPWDMGGIAGIRRFLERTWRLCDKVSNKTSLKQSASHAEANNIEAILHRTIMKVGNDIEQLKFNTAISALMIFLSELEKSANIDRKIFSAFILMLAPFVPHFAEEIWEILGYKTSIHKQKWPAYKESLTVKQKNVYIIQVNGKRKGDILGLSNLTEKQTRELVSTSPKFHKWLNGRKIIRVIYVPNRLINFVVR